MGETAAYTPYKLVLPTLLSVGVDPDDVALEMRGAFGSVDRVGPVLPFPFTRYYEREMGSGLRRLFWSAETLVSPDSLARIKLTANDLEKRLARHGSRRVNLDPGLLCESRFVLASTKDSSHRIPVGSGIFAEVTLRFERGEFRPLEWTYPDYRSAEYREILRDIRTRYRAQLSMQAGEKRAP